MSAAIVERARAFSMIAEHLPAEKRAEVAEALAEKLLAEVKPKRDAASQAGASVAVEDELVDLSGHTETASFLVDKGLTGRALVAAHDRLFAWLASDEFGHLPRDSRMQAWWASKYDKGSL